jgi:hypothetical protein
MLSNTAGRWQRLNNKSEQLTPSIFHSEWSKLDPECYYRFVISVIFVKQGKGKQHMEPKNS